MADRMEFPKTMKEFIEGYSFKDSEEVYTNGSELVPVFRVDQALEHYEKKIRAKIIDETIETAAQAICVGCGHLDGYRCTYKGANCAVSKPMLESVVKKLEQMKEGGKDA